MTFIQRSCIQETLNILKWANSSTDTKTKRNRQKEAKKIYIMFYVSHVTCHVSCVMCHVSQVTCHLSHVTNTNSHSHSRTKFIEGKKPRKVFSYANISNTLLTKFFSPHGSGVSLMAQTHTKTTHGHCNLETKPIQWAVPMKIKQLILSAEAPLKTEQYRERKSIHTCSRLIEDMKKKTVITKQTSAFSN